ncbi:hypothetical protein TNCV_4794391 [Trichonephila clavipes]|nr:hypothetical protein TNCV_4794391 [Trichonephila clavipes]
MPSHLGIISNEEADIAAWSATTDLSITVPIFDMKRVIQHHLDSAWQESWNLQPATPDHILEYLGLTKLDLADDPLLVLDFLKVYDVMDLA